MSLLEPRNRADHRRELEPIARKILPALGYSPQAIEDFLAKDPPDAEFFSFRINDHHAVMQIVRDGEGWLIRYVLPSDWNGRFQIVAGAIEGLKQRFLQNPGRRIFMLIRENPPSHSSYFAGMLPSLGFKMLPRVTFLRAFDEQGPPLPALPYGFKEIELTEADLDAAADAYHAAHVEHSPHVSAQEHERHRLDRRATFHREFALDDARRTWVTIAHDNQIVATAFGRARGKELSIDEVGVVPEHRGLHIGRYICLRVMQKLREHFNAPNRFFFVGTDRRYVRAMQLYPSLGFKLHEFHTYAMFESPCHSADAERGSGGR